MSCDVSHCDNHVAWVHIGEGGDLYLCAEHFYLDAATARATGWTPIGDES